MADNTPIEWTDATWNPNRGCTRVAEGCRNCYAEVMAARFSDPGQWGHGLATRVTLPDGSTDHRWTGKVAMIEDMLDQPLRWKRPRRIFVNSTSDTFHEAVPDDWLDRIFAVMALSPRHTFQVLTKRPERAQAYLSKLSEQPPEWRAKRLDYAPTPVWPLPNVWLGTTVENQTEADRRIPHLLATPAAVRFLSVEPMLGPVALTWAFPDLRTACCHKCGFRTNQVGGICPNDGSYLRGDIGIDWIICGGESGPGARVWEGFTDAARSLRGQCRSAGVAFFMKQMAGPRKATMPPIPEDLMVREFPNAGGRS